MKKIEKLYSHYLEWEDYKNGMYDYCKSENDERLIELAKSLLCNDKEFEATIIEVLNNWPVSSLVNLTNNGSNRRSWLGQASCSYKHNVPEILTREAWNRMSEIERFNANTVAESIISEFER